MATVKENILVAIGKAKQTWADFKVTKPGKLLTIITGNFVNRLIGITMAAVVIIGLAVASVPVAVISLVSIGIGATMDTLQLRSVRKLKQENKLLVKFRSAKSSADTILKIDPRLKEILKDQLYVASNKVKKSHTDRYIKDNQNERINLNIFGKALLKNGLKAATNIVVAIGTGGVFGVIKQTVGAAYGLASEQSKRSKINDVELKFKRQIDAERNKKDTPGYNNLRGLKKAAREQHIESLALKKLVKDESYFGMSDKKIKKRFKEIKIEITASEKAVSGRKTGVARVGEVTKSYGKDLVRAHDPFSKYNDPNKIHVKGHTPLAKAREHHHDIDEETRKTIKEHLSSSTGSHTKHRASTKHIVVSSQKAK